MKLEVFGVFSTLALSAAHGVHGLRGHEEHPPMMMRTMSPRSGFDSKFTAMIESCQEDYLKLCAGEQFPPLFDGGPNFGEEFVPEFDISIVSVATIEEESEQPAIVDVATLEAPSMRETREVSNLRGDALLKPWLKWDDGSKDSSESDSSSSESSSSNSGSESSSSDSEDVVESRFGQLFFTLRSWAAGSPGPSHGPPAPAIAPHPFSAHREEARMCMRTNFAKLNPVCQNAMTDFHQSGQMVLSRDYDRSRDIGTWDEDENHPHHPLFCLLILALAVVGAVTVVKKMVACCARRRATSRRMVNGHIVEGDTVLMGVPVYAQEEH